MTNNPPVASKPPVAGGLPIVKLKFGEGRRVRAGAPWVYSNEIVMDEVAKALPPGSLVQLAAGKGVLVGSGYFNRNSLITVRLLGPPDITIDRAFFAEKIRQALNIRKRVFREPYYRLVHAEGDGLPGLVVDRFADTLVVQITTAGMEGFADTIVEILEKALAPKNIVLRNDAPWRVHEGLESYVRIAKGNADPVVVEENGAHYLAEIAGGQKSGWYYDQRENRAFMASLAHGTKFLDAYSYSGGFGVLAARSGADEVTLIDTSEPALALARGAAENNVVASRCAFVKGEVFAELERRALAGEHFDIVVCDPPPFVRARKDLEPGAKAYRKLARLAASVVAPDGFLFLASCSHNIGRERFALECAGGIRRAGRTGRLIRDAGAGPDHPVHPMLPETAYLKALVYALD